MTELDVKLVKVDNWGIFFLQRLKHFFNRTDYCDLTLQFQDNAQLKVHRLVLSACTEYFELLERTCEMYEDCLVMPDDLQADVVVPIVNFMYTGQLEFRMDLLERLYQTSQIMNMPVLTKLLDAHRSQAVITPLKSSMGILNNTKRSYSKSKDKSRSKQIVAPASSSHSSKRPYSAAFGSPTSQNEHKKTIIQKPDIATNNSIPQPYNSPSPKPPNTVMQRKVLGEPRPTRYELPEELDTDNIFDNSFVNISYTSQPLMVHPETTKHYKPKRSGIFGEGSSSNKSGTSTLDIVECRKVPKKEKECIFEDHSDLMNDDLEMFQVKDSSPNVSNQLFDQIIEQPTGPKVTIETKDAKQASNIDHAKIISEVLKKYPHLVKSNKNIKLKILNTPTPAPTSPKLKPKKQRSSPTPYHKEKEVKMKTEMSEHTYETDVLDSKEAARLIAMGAENVKGPWICLICGTPGRALHFTSYYKFRRHLVEVHNEKPVANMCEYCGLKSLKRNYLLHHLLTKHGVEPPPQYNFPRCNVCSYIALTEGLLVKHKMTHTDVRNFRCNVCPASYSTSSQLLTHIQKTGHKYCADRKTNLQCVYCLKVFMREGNLYAHLKTYHKQAAKSDGIIDDSDDEQSKEETTIKYEPQSYEPEYEDVETQYQIRPDGNLELVAKKQRPVIPSPTKQKILNTGFELPIQKPVQKEKPPTPMKQIPQIEEDPTEEIVMIDNNEYIMKNNQLILNKKGNNEFILPEMMVSDPNASLTSESLDYSNIQNEVVEENLHEQKIMIKKTENMQPQMNQPIQIVVSNEEEYKALMNSNHSIIFEDGDTSKTLTVLSTAEHSTGLNPVALVENAQPNNMMIIQENYPISVSDAMTGDNSNIVVVYSHAMDDQNKQFQLITSQDIGAQFVQSSAVITQNYVTPTAATPTLTQEIDTQTAESWQRNIPGGQNTSSVTELQEMTIVEQALIPNDSSITSIETTDIAPVEPTEISSADPTEIKSDQHAELTAIETDSVNTVEDLPDVALAPVASQTGAETTLQENGIVETLPQINDNENNNESVQATSELKVTDGENLSVNERHDATFTSIDVDLSAQSSMHNITEQSSIHNSTEHIVENTKPTLGESITEESITEEPCNTGGKNIAEHHLAHQSENIVSSGGDNTVEEYVSTESNEICEVSETADNETDDLDGEEIIEEQVETVSSVSPRNTEITDPQQTKEQIQNLTSEWSEDEYDIAEEQAQAEETDEQLNVSETEPHEIEESIENIQQEMQKQISETTETVDSENIVSENITTPSENTIKAVAPLEKISSLLNDWDENDSQEGNDSTNGTEESVTTKPSTVDQEPKNIAVLEKIGPKKDDKIQSLVSDWDDEEDDKI